MAEDIKNIFISHIHVDDDGLAKLKELVTKSGLKTGERRFCKLLILWWT
jgi:hypothetical protein